MAKPSTSLLKRRLDIAEIVRKNGEIKVDDLAEMLAVSGVTIRNDLNYLEQQGYLKRSFGGAIYTAQPVRASVTQDMSLVQEWDRSAELELAKQVARLVADEDSLFLGAGVVPRKALPFLGESRELRLAFNDLGHVSTARDYIDGEIVLLGGTLDRSGQRLEGEIAIQSIQRFQPTCSVVMIEHVSEDGTLSVASESAAVILAESLRLSLRCVAVIAQRPDYGEARYSVGKLSALSAVVTPQIVAAEYHSRFIAVGLTNSYTNNECLTWINPALLPAR
ncbi:DeoR/GlpR family DNA-binding transcription regulator [Citrobacter freundii]|uniref:DeoR/GlpR family DNA-binding transcription regulator n=1 Tax=Citrobacter freundii TaxID=546 RepID=UPI0028BF2EF4|nr:DeoR/GlpR family DNA-binding transcription regulator [Citrobacter freundii]MDT7328318.1 DeoR/GlpR family DNA-binding transcription regulator [Citrobacter freundii]MDT7401082.1 DeoR/GlpR family DNA-binding transcription regulator [Citrobacter freundii]MDV1746896.1 DeoR/GlpR family DNA-binding transcription regulator [Citrobacter freundii]MEB0444675.1 DeoR/GlpR family DNA-binding transcription regulator [Citrobacter freundii]HBV7988005.1 DeoR/GlpR transcriptional regulator [Citrobacter freund